MSALSTLSSLSDHRRWLVQLMQLINYGRIEDLRIQDGEPLRNPAPRVYRKLKCGGDNSPRPEASCPDFWLKQQTTDLFRSLTEMGTGTVIVLEIKGGLPFSFEVELTSFPNTNPGERYG